MSKIDEIKKALEENTEEWAKTANQVIKEAANGTEESSVAERSNSTKHLLGSGRS